MAEDNKLGRKITTLREAHHLTSQDLADRCGCDVALIQELEAGEVPASLAPLIKITRALGFESATGMVNGVLRNLARKREELKQPAREDGIEHFLSIEYSMPEFVCRRLIEQYGADEAERILAWKPQRFITVRPNTLRISAAEFEARLDKLELRWEHSLSLIHI